MTDEIQIPRLTSPPMCILKTDVLVHEGASVWTWGTENNAAAIRHFEELRRANATLWNGPVFLCTGIRVEGQILKGNVLRTDYATYLYHRALDWPDTSMKLLFGSAFIQAANGSLFFGKMSQQTTSPGVVVAPSGGLGADDIQNNKIDPISTAFRECEEEFGISLSQARYPTYFASIGRSLCVYVHAKLDLEEDVLFRKIRRFIEDEDNSELEQVQVIRSDQDLSEIESYDYSVAIGSYLLSQNAS